jgi:8-oxoguanine deaminase
MIGGEWVVEEGRIPGLDIDDLIRRHSAAARQLQSSVPPIP